MNELSYKDIAAFADSSVDIRSIIDSLLHSDIDSCVYDYLVGLENTLINAESKLRRQYQRNGLYCYKKKVGGCL